MRAIVSNDLAELEDSVANQQSLSAELGDLADSLRSSALTQHSVPTDNIDDELVHKMRTAAGELQRLNLRYSILLKYSSRSVAMMAALFNSFKGQIQEASGAGLKHQTWSCRM